MTFINCYLLIIIYSYDPTTRYEPHTTAHCHHHGRQRTLGGRAGKTTQLRPSGWSGCCEEDYVGMYTSRREIPHTLHLLHRKLEPTRHGSGCSHGTGAHLLRGRDIHEEQRAIRGYRRHRKTARGGAAEIAADEGAHRCQLCHDNGHSS